MHDGDPYGHLTAGGVPIDAVQLARIVGVSRVAKLRAWLTELETRKVFSRSDGGVIYSRRMVRDEHNRNVRAAGGRLSLENPNVPRPKDEAKDGGKDILPRLSGGSLERSPAVAVSGLRSAVADSPLDLDPENSNKRSSTAPLAGASSSDGEPHAETGVSQFMAAFYAKATRKRRDDVERQLMLTTTRGAPHPMDPGSLVRAGSIDRLNAKCRDVVDEGVRDRDKAIVVLLIKLADTSDVSENHAANARREAEADNTEYRLDLAKAEAWLRGRPELAERIEAAGGADDLAGYAQRLTREAKVINLWRGAGAPMVPGAVA